MEEEKGDLDGNVIVDVHSPQLKAEWNYLYNRKECKIYEINKIYNAFVEKAVQYAMEFSLSKTTKNPSKIGIKILFDRGFLSETPQQRVSRAKFLCYEPGIAKTGLGSSACVVVTIVGGLIKLLIDSWSEK